MPTDGYGERIARLEEQMNALREDLHDLYAVIHDREGGVRARLHRLENDSAAAKAAEAALTAASAMRDQTEQRGFTRREKLIGLAIAFAAVAVQLSGFHF